MSDTSVVPVREGDVLAGKYRVEKILGQGGMGVVVAAHHVALNQRVAMKFLLAHAAENGESVARFLREARAAVQITSEHVARVSDVGTLESGAPYMVMEFLQGQDLSQVLASNGPLGIEQAADYVIQACDAIAEAHKLGIVHRDLKPANLFMSRRADGSAIIKVLDFGISKALSDGAAGAVTATGMIFGSPLYMSPEQMKSAKDVDHRTDIWALGVILFELLTRTELFIADTLPGIVSRIVAEPPMPLRQLRPDAPAELEALIQRCLEKNRDNRLPDVAELAIGLLPYAPSHVRPIAERIVRVVKGAGATVSTFPPPNRTAPMGASTAAAWGSTNANTQTAKKPSIAIAAGALAFLALAGGGIFFFASRAPKEDSAKTVTTQPVEKEKTPATQAESAKPDPEPTPTAAKTTDEPTPTATAPTAAPPPAATTVATTKSAPAKTATIAAVKATATASAKPTASAAKPSTGSFLDDRK